MQRLTLPCVQWGALKQEVEHCERWTLVHFATETTKVSRGKEENQLNGVELVEVRVMQLHQEGKRFGTVYLIKLWQSVGCGFDVDLSGEAGNVLKGHQC